MFLWVDVSPNLVQGQADLAVLPEGSQDQFLECSSPRHSVRWHEAFRELDLIITEGDGLFYGRWTNLLNIVRHGQDEEHTHKHCWGSRRCFGVSVAAFLPPVAKPLTQLIGHMNELRRILVDV